MRGRWIRAVRWNRAVSKPSIGDRRHMAFLKACPACGKAGFHATDCPGILGGAAP